MASPRHLLVLLCAPVLIACIDVDADTMDMFGDGSAKEPTPKQAPKLVQPNEQAALLAGSGVLDAVQAVKDNLWDTVTSHHHQLIVAILALEFGLVALYDGRRFFQVLVIVSAVAVTYCLVLSQMSASCSGMVGPLNELMKYAASVEVAVFIGVSAYKGWEGTQLLLGLAVGLYVFHLVQTVALLLDAHVPTAGAASILTNLQVATVACTLSMAAGSWMVHEKYGAGRVLGIVAPLFGSSLLVSVCGYFSMYICSYPAVAASLKVTVKWTDVPSVFEFWCMIAYPMHSQAVGYFTFIGQYVTVGKTTYDIDRLLGLFFLVFFWLIAAKLQLRWDRRAREANDPMKARLLDEENNSA